MVNIGGGQFLQTDGTPAALGVLTLTLSVAATVISTGAVAAATYTINLDANGVIIGQANVNGNAELTPAGTSYSAVVKIGATTVWGPLTWIVGPSAAYAGTLFPGVMALPLITGVVFGASGTLHAQGSVPDPGAAAGTTKFLREDATFAVPAGGGAVAGSDTQIQYNNTGAFAASSPLVWDYTNRGLKVYGTITSGKINKIFYVDGITYALTGQGIRSAIADAVAAGGGKVIVTQVCTLDSTTIIVGQESPSKPVYLSLEYMGNMTGVANPVFELTSHSAIVGLNRRATQLTIPAGGTGIRITTPAEDWDIANLWFQAGAIAIKSRGNSSTVDTPNGRIRYNFLQSQTGNAIELASFADGATLDTNFTNSSGGAGIRIGVLNNGEPNGGTNENSSIINNFVQNAGTKGIWIEPTAFTTAWQAVGLILDNNQISTPANDGLWIKGGIRLCDIRNTLFVGAITGTINTYDHLHIEQFVGGVVQFNNRVSGVYQGDSTKPRYSIFWDQLDPTNSGLGGNILERVQVSTGQTSGIYVRGDIKITDIGNSVIAPTSLFQSASAFTGGLQFTMKNQINSPMVMALDSGLNAIQNTTLSFRDRGTSKFEIIKTDTNEIDFNIPGVGTFLRVVAGTILPVFQVDNAAAIAVKNAAATTTVLAVDTTSGGNGVNCTAPAGGGFSLNAGGTAHLNTLWLVAKMSRYQDIATVSGGIPAEYATIDTTGLTANVAAATLYAATASGMYRVSAYVVETTAGSVSSTLPNVQIIYTDPDTNASITIDATPVLGVAGIGQTGALTANTIGTASSGVIAISVKTGTTIQYQTVGYASSAAGMAYALHIKLEAL